MYNASVYGTLCCGKAKVAGCLDSLDVQVRDKINDLCEDFITVLNVHNAKLASAGAEMFGVENKWDDHIQELALLSPEARIRVA